MRDNAEHRTRLGEFMIEVYNADKAALDRMMYGRGRRGLIEKFDRMIIPRLPEGMRPVDHHASRFRQIVDRWLQGQLTESDEDVIAAFLSLPMKHPIRVQRLLRRFAIGEFRKNPYEPLTRAYAELYQMMQLEEFSQLPFRPRFCEFCRRLFLPVRRTIQTTCSKRCAHMVRYRRYLDRQQAAVRTTWVEAFTGAKEGAGARGKAERTRS